MEFSSRSISTFVEFSATMFWDVSLTTLFLLFLAVCFESDVFREIACVWLKRLLDAVISCTRRWVTDLPPSWNPLPEILWASGLKFWVNIWAFTFLPYLPALLNGLCQSYDMLWGPSWFYSWPSVNYGALIFVEPSKLSLRTLFRPVAGRSLWR